MPNYVRNVVKMKGIGKQPLFSIENPGDNTPGVELAVRSYEYFDFQKLVPAPEELNLEEDNIQRDMVDAALGRIASVVWKDHSDISSTNPGAHQDFSRIAAKYNMTIREAEDLGFKYLENAFRYGHFSRYRWCLDHWGTPWNSLDVEHIDEDTIAFNTANCPPTPIIDALNLKYPGLEIEHWWADEDIGCNTGYRYVSDQDDDTEEPDDRSQEAFENYVKCWGMDDRLERDGQGNLRYIREEE